MVYLDETGSRSLSGPYLVASVSSDGKYTLCLENGDKVEGGKIFVQDELVKA